MVEIGLVNSPYQTVSAILDRRRVSMTFWYSTVNDRWSMNLAVDDEPILHGRRVVLGVDLLRDHDLGIGQIFAHGSGEPDRQNLINGVVRVYHRGAGDAV